MEKIFPKVLDNDTAMGCDAGLLENALSEENSLVGGSQSNEDLCKEIVKASSPFSTAKKQLEENDDTTFQRTGENDTGASEKKTENLEEGDYVGVCQLEDGHWKVRWKVNQYHEGDFVALCYQDSFSIDECLEKKTICEKEGSIMWFLDLSHQNGDSGYPLRAWLMTLVENPQPGTPEERYNLSHRQCRCTIERCNGLLKMRFRCLLKERTLHYAPVKACQIIKACCVLHNLCVENNVDMPEDDEAVNDEDLGLFNNMLGNQNLGNRRVNHELLAGRTQRQKIIRRFQ